jgi:hypothetical protein
MCEKMLPGCAGGKYEPTTSPRRAEAPPRYNTARMNRNDGPEDSSLGERCLTGGLPEFGGATGSFRRIVQTPGGISMFYDVGQGQGWQRNIVMDGSPHLPASIRQWFGDSRGHWEGDALVVDVTNFSPKTQRPLSERCLLGFGSTSGPPALPDYFYNDLHQIVQTPDAIMILTEMVHDARIVRMNAQHLPNNIRRWMGDSVGHWDGDTLVVDTTNFNDKTRFRGSTENLHVIERFTRINDKTLLYRFTVEDPDTWDRPWTGEYTWPATTKPIYEYACHEGNYALGSILRGARRQEAEEAAAQAKK